MAENLDDIFKSEPQAQDTAEPVEQQEAPPQEAPQDGAPAAHEDDPQGSHVPVSAFVKAREDWKQKATRADEQAKLYREENERLRKQAESFQQFQQSQQQLSPEQALEARLFDERCNMSRMALLSEVKDESLLDQKAVEFAQLVQQDHTLADRMRNSPHPWKFVLDTVKQAAFLKEVGSDPDAYRAKVEAEIMAKLQAQQPQTTAPLNVPASLNGARSVAPRNAPTFSGPTPLGSIFNR